MGSGPQSDFNRTALAVWIRKLDVLAVHSGSGAPASSADEVVIDWIVAFVRCGWTPGDDGLVISSFWWPIVQDDHGWCCVGMSPPAPMDLKFRVGSRTSFTVSGACHLTMGGLNCALFFLGWWLLGLCVIGC